MAAVAALVVLTAAAMAWLAVRDDDRNPSAEPAIGARGTSTGGGLQTPAPAATDDGRAAPLGGPAQDRPVLGYGSAGADVAALQRLLADLGFDPGTADGQFGPATAAAVTAFQDSRGITADGVVGPETWVALDQRP